MKSFLKLIKSNIREYGMYIALLAIMVYFQYASAGSFLSPYNFNNLLMQTGYVAILAIGMTLVIVIRHIDLSVGFTAGFLGAVAAILLSKYNINPFLVLTIVLTFGLLVGLGMGTLVAKVGIPSFVATLAGMLFFQGALLKVTKSETILINNKVFKAIGEGHLPTFGIVSVKVLTLLIAFIGIALYILSEVSSRNKKKQYGFDTIGLPFFIGKLALISLAILYFVDILANYQGIPITVAIVFVVLAIYHFITSKTVIGRHVYAVGGNPEAAKLSGINVTKITILVFGSMGMLSALSGILFATRLGSASPSAGRMFELEAIAAAYIGGVSAAGGVGKVTGSIIGALVMASLTSGMNLIHVGTAEQNIVRALILVAAVIFDIKTRNMKVSE